MAKLRVFVLPRGKIQIFVDEGTEEEARAATKTILAQLNAAGIPFSQIGEIELHRQSLEHVHVIEEVHLDH